MKEIKFRGLAIEEGVTTSKWVFGDYISQPEWEEIVHYDKSKTIIDSIHQKVDPKTVGQFTGLLDRNGKEVYEGDLYKTLHSTKIYTIFFKNSAFCGGLTLDYCMPLAWNIHEEVEIVEDDEISSLIEVIGNIYETTNTNG